jgi:hypothetical protein
MNSGFDQNWEQINANAMKTIQIRKLKKQIKKLNYLLLNRNNSSNLSQNQEIDGLIPNDIEFKLDLNHIFDDFQNNCIKNDVLNEKESQFVENNNNFVVKELNEPKTKSFGDFNRKFDKIEESFEEMTNRVIDKSKQIDELIEKNNVLNKGLTEKERQLKVLINAKQRSDTKVEKLEDNISALKFQIRELGSIPSIEKFNFNQYFVNNFEINNQNLIKTSNDSEFKYNLRSKKLTITESKKLTITESNSQTLKASKSKMTSKSKGIII